MAHFIARKSEDDVKARLKRRAARSGRGMKKEVRHISRDAAKQGRRTAPKLGSRIAARFAGRGLTEPLPLLRRQTSRWAKFK